MLWTSTLRKTERLVVSFLQRPSQLLFVFLFLTISNKLPVGWKRENLAETRAITDQHTFTSSKQLVKCIHVVIIVLKKM